MNKLALIAALAFSSAAFAAPAANPTSTGNFRRADAIQAAGANPKTAKVVSLTTSNHRDLKQTAQPADARILFVQDGNKVTPVKAPLDLSQKVTKLSTTEVDNLGLVTQAQAKKLAIRNGGGQLDGKGKIIVTDDGLGKKRGSYLFAQKAPSTVNIDEGGYKYSESNITRSVSVSGKGTSAHAGSWAPISTPTPAAAPAAPAAPVAAQ